MVRNRAWLGWDRDMAMTRVWLSQVSGMYINRARRELRPVPYWNSVLFYIATLE